MHYTECLAECGYEVEKAAKSGTGFYVSKPCERVSTIIASKNGITLVEVMLNDKPVHYELYMDDFLLNRFKNEKIAKSMFKDFSAN